MDFLRKYSPILFIWILTIVIIIISWTSNISGRTVLIFPAAIASIGYYLLYKGIEGKKLIEKLKIIEPNKEISTGLSKIVGIIEPIKEFNSFLNEELTVFYDLVVEKGETEFHDVNAYNVYSKNPSDKFKSAKWTFICRKSEWTPFNIRIKDENGEDKKIYAENPEEAEGNWIFNTLNIPNPIITPLNEANEKIQKLVREALKNKKNIEEGRYIRYLERTIKPYQNITAYGNIEINENKDSEAEYKLTKKEKDDIFILTNDDNFDLYKQEQKEYIKGLVLLILGLIGYIFGFLWPYIIDIAVSST